jgi:hypothetical protein
MKLNALFLAVGLAAAGTASAADADVEIEDIRAETGLREREVRMMIGAPSSYAEYRTSYRQARDRMARAARYAYEERVVVPEYIEETTTTTTTTTEEVVEPEAAQTFPFRDD